MDTSSILVPLDAEQMCDLYMEIKDELGKASVGKVAKWLADHGIINQMTKRPYTRQNVHLAMLKSLRAKKILPHRKRT